MRRALLASLPALTRLYGLKPWEVDLLSWDELDVYLSAAEKMMKDS